MKGYIITENGKCDNLLYLTPEARKTNEFIPLNKKSGIELYKRGLHFDFDPDNLFDWYSYKKGVTKIFEVEAIGEIRKDISLAVTNKMKIIREIPMKEYNILFKKHRFDENGNKIETIPDKEYGIKKYDEKGNLIYEEDEMGDWVRYEYDEKGNLIYEEDSENYEISFQYDEQGNKIYEKNSDGDWVRYKYNRNEIIYLDSDNINYKIIIETVNETNN